MSGEMSKAASRIARANLDNEFVAREQLETWASEARSGVFATPMEGVSAIAERAGLRREERLELRRIALGQKRAEVVSIGDTVSIHPSGGKGMVVRTGAPVPHGKAHVRVATSGKVEEFYLSDLSPDNS